MEQLTARQAEALGAIRAEQQRLGVSPTIRELGVALGMVSTNAVVDVLKVLERKGYLRRVPRSARSIVLLGESVEPRPRLLVAAEAALRALRRGDADAAQSLLSEALGE